MRARQFKEVKYDPSLKPKPVTCPWPRKAIYPDGMKANSAAIGAGADHRGIYEAYKCPTGEHWHIGHSNRGKAPLKDTP